MKQSIVILLCIAILLSLACCGKQEVQNVNIHEVLEKQGGQADESASAAESVEEVPEESSEEIPETLLPEEFSPDFTFSTTDRDGNTYDESLFARSRLTVINFWEPWCGPCVGEMPDLQALYEKYSGQGVSFIGVYQTEGMEEDVDAVLKQTGVKYPILHYCDAFRIFETGFVPGTVFVDGNGHIVMHEEDPFVKDELRGTENEEWLSKAVYVGSADAATWDARIQEALNAE